MHRVKNENFLNQQNRQMLSLSAWLPCALCVSIIINVIV